MLVNPIRINSPLVGQRTRWIRRVRPADSGIRRRPPSLKALDTTVETLDSDPPGKSAAPQQEVRVSSSAKERFPYLVIQILYAAVEGWASSGAWNGPRG